MINLIINREVSGNYCLCAVSGWASRKLKQNEQNIDMYITTNRSFYPILFDMEK